MGTSHPIRGVDHKGQLSPKRRILPRPAFDPYIRQIAEQGTVPIVRNVPHDGIENSNVIALPKSDDLT